MIKIGPGLRKEIKMAARKMGLIFPCNKTLLRAIEKHKHLDPNYVLDKRVFIEPYIIKVEARGRFSIIDFAFHIVGLKAESQLIQAIKGELNLFHCHEVNLPFRVRRFPIEIVFGVGREKINISISFKKGYIYLSPREAEEMFRVMRKQCWGIFSSDEREKDDDPDKGNNHHPNLDQHDNPLIGRRWGKNRSLDCCKIAEEKVGPERRKK